MQGVFAGSSTDGNLRENVEVDEVSFDVGNKQSAVMCQSLIKCWPFELETSKQVDGHELTALGHAKLIGYRVSISLWKA